MISNQAVILKSFYFLFTMATSFIALASFYFFAFSNSPIANAIGIALLISTTILIGMTKIIKPILKTQQETMASIARSALSAKFTELAIKSLPVTEEDSLAFPVAFTKYDSRDPLVWRGFIVENKLTTAELLSTHANIFPKRK